MALLLRPLLVLALVSPFKALSLRLNVGEVGVVKSTFGLHVIQRVR